MSSFSIGDDDFAELRKGKFPAAAEKSAKGSVTKLGAVPLKTPAAPNGKCYSTSSMYAQRHPTRKAWPCNKGLAFLFSVQGEVSGASCKVAPGGNKS